MASPHLSIRVDPETLTRLDKASRRSGRTRSWLAKTLIEEGLRMDAHPGIVFRDGPAGRRAGLARGPDVWEVMTTFENREHITEEEIAYAAESLALSIPEVRHALGYYRSYKDEIGDWIRSNDEAFEEGYTAWLATQTTTSR